MFELMQNAPNPFNPTTTIRYIVPRRSRVEVVIYNLLGRKIRTLVDRDHSPGQYSAVWDGKDNTGRQVASGVYFYSLKADGFIKSKKMVLLK